IRAKLVTGVQTCALPIFGVTFVSGGVPQTVRTRGEVIVSAGVFNSPHLLQLSGLGPPELLQAFGIPVIREMPTVGADMQDHFNRSEERRVGKECRAGRRQ